MRFAVSNVSGWCVHRVSNVICPCGLSLEKKERPTRVSTLIALFENLVSRDCAGRRNLPPRAVGLQGHGHVRVRHTPGLPAGVAPARGLSARRHTVFIHSKSIYSSPKAITEEGISPRADDCGTRPTSVNRWPRGRNHRRRPSRAITWLKRCRIMRPCQRSVSQYQHNL